jgi:hypothetical protein
MLKRSATILVMLLTLGLLAFGEPYGEPSRLCSHAHSVPEPGSLLVFGTGILLSFKSLRRKG